MFSDVLDLVPQSNVKVNDVAVGKVDRVKLDGWTAEVKVKVKATSICRRTRSPTSSRPRCSGRSSSSSAQPQIDARGHAQERRHHPAHRRPERPRSRRCWARSPCCSTRAGCSRSRPSRPSSTRPCNGNEAAVRDLLTQMNGFVGRPGHAEGQDHQRAGQHRPARRDAEPAEEVADRRARHLPEALKILADDRDPSSPAAAEPGQPRRRATRVINATETTLTSALIICSPCSNSSPRPVRTCRTR